MAADATTAMTIDFLRARLLSERSVSRAAKDRADHLAGRVAELEEQLRTVTTQRREAERATAEVLAILEAQGFGRFSDDDDGGTGTAESGKEAEDALSGSELGDGAAAAHVGGLSWKGRAASPGAERRQPHQRGRQLRQRHGHGHRRSYFYLLAAGPSSPKYQPGQSCRKIRRKELRLQTEDEEGKDNVAGSPDERSDCTVCTDEQRDLDGEASHDGRGSSGDGRAEDGSDGYTMEYDKGGEMERVLEKQAELIGRHEAQENAQREWEKKFNGSRDSAADDVNLDKKLSPAPMHREVVCEEAKSSGENIFGINSSIEYLSNGSVSGLSTNAPEGNAFQQCEVVQPDHNFGQATEAVASADSESQDSKEEWVIKRCTKTIGGSGNSLGRSAPSPQRSYNSNRNTGQDKGQGDGNSDSGSSYRFNACSFENCINSPSVGSPLSDTPKSKISEWSSSCFHNQIGTHLYQQSSDDVGGVLEALQRAKMSLREKLSRPNPFNQEMLALPAPHDLYTKDNLPVNDAELSICMPPQLSREMWALQTFGKYHGRNDLACLDAKVPIGPAGLFRLPTDSFPRNEVCSNDGYGSKFSLTAISQHDIFSSSYANHIMSTPALPQYGYEFSMNPYSDPRSSMLL